MNDMIDHGQPDAQGSAAAGHLPGHQLPHRPLLRHQPQGADRSGLGWPGRAVAGRPAPDVAILQRETRQAVSPNTTSSKANAATWTRCCPRRTPTACACCPTASRSPSPWTSPTAIPEYVNAAPMLQKYWKAVGRRCQPKVEDRSLMYARKDANDCDCYCLGRRRRAGRHHARAAAGSSPYSTESAFAVAWYYWWVKDARSVGPGAARLRQEAVRALRHSSRPPATPRSRTI